MPTSTTCHARTKKGSPCARKAGADGYCYQHSPDAPSAEPALTEKQRRFVEAYMGQAAGNATEAAELAGYAGDRSTLQVVGAENLLKPIIRQAIEERVDADPLVATRFDRQRFWTRVMLGKELDGEDPPAMRDRLKAASDLAKAQGDFIERVEHSGPGGGPIETLLSPEDRKARIGELLSITGSVQDGAEEP